MLTLQVRGITDALAKVDGIAPRMRAELRTTVARETIALQAYVIENKLSGQVLNARSGAGRRSITSEVVETPDEIRGKVGTNLNYMLAHEYGATIHHPGSVARAGHALRFVVGGKVIFAKRTRPHTIRLPERSFLRSSLRERADEIIAAIRDTIRRVLS